MSQTLDVATEPGSAPRGRRLGVLALTSLVTLVVLALVLRTVDPAAVLTSLSRADAGLLVLVLLLPLVVDTLLAALTLRETLRSYGVKTTYAAALAATAGNLAIHQSMPSSIGIFGRVVYLARAHGVDERAGSLSVVTVLWLKLGWLLLMAAIASWFVAGTGLPVRLGLVAAWLGVLSLAAVAPWLARRLGERAAAGRVGAALGAVGAIRARRPALLRASLSALPLVALEPFVFWLALLALGGSIEPLVVLAAIPLCIIVAKLPITLMGLGTREAMVLTLFSGLEEPETLLLASLLYGAGQHLLPALVGALLTFPFVGRIVRGRVRG